MSRATVNKEPFIISVPFCLMMLTVGLVTLTGSTIMATLNILTGKVGLAIVNLGSGVVGAMVVAANVFFVANAVVRRARWTLQIKSLELLEMPTRERPSSSPGGLRNRDAGLRTH
jgi:hypothetical protein